MAETIDSFETPAGNKWELRRDARGIEYAVASHRSNKQPIASYNAAKAGAASAEKREEKYGTSQPGENQPAEPEPPQLGDRFPINFSKIEIDPSTRSRTSPFEDLEQWKAPVRLDLKDFQEQVGRWADRMADIQIRILDAVSDEYYTHCNWGAELTVTEKVEQYTIEMEKAVSTVDIQANNIFPADAPETYHPRHTNHPGTNPEPGTNFRFIQLINSLSDVSYQQTTVATVWVELLKYPPEADK